MKLALHRSITFWSGVLVMVFIGWAWWDSEREWSTAAWHEISVQNAWGGLLVSCKLQYLPSGIQFDRHPLDPDFLHQPEIFPGPQFVRNEDVTDAELAQLSLRLFDFDGERYTPRPTHYTIREFMGLSFDPRRVGGWMFFLPYSLLLLAIITVWLALLVWRGLRRKRSA